MNPDILRNSVYKQKENWWKILIFWITSQTKKIFFPTMS